MSQDNHYKSAYTRLGDMPDVFNAITFARLNNMTTNEASVYLARMKSKKMLASFNGRAGIYFNLIKNSNAKNAHLIDGLKMIYPTAILRGESVLHAAGWTTQIPRRINVAILERRTYVNIKEFVLSPKKKDWFITIHRYLLKPENSEFSTYGLPSLTPALALADLYTKNAIRDWQPDPDDLDIEDSDWLNVQQAFNLLGATIPEKYQSYIDEAEEANCGVNFSN